MESKKSLQFGRKYQVGNYFVMKYNRVLSKGEVRELRVQAGIPDDLRKSLQRAQLPYMKVEAVSGIWSMYYCCNTSVFRMIDSQLDVENERSVEMFAHLFNMWFMDTMVPGDEQYVQDKARAFKAFMERRKAKDVSEYEEKAVLDDMREDEQAKANIIEMGKTLNEDENEDGKR